MLRVALARRRVATKVVVSGGGPAGLVTALALGRAGTPCALVEPRTAPSAHPRAHVLTARTLEICEDLGLGDALRQIAPPLERWRRFRYCDRVDGADYAVADHGAAPAWANLEAASDQRVQHISQPVFEALLRRAVADKKSRRDGLELGLRVLFELYAREKRGGGAKPPASKRRSGTSNTSSYNMASS